jgi:hypothetical protein
VDRESSRQGFGGSSTRTDVRPDLLLQQIEWQTTVPQHHVVEVANIELASEFSFGRRGISAIFSSPIL